MKNIKLSPEQTKAIDGIRFILSDRRLIGKSFLIAVCLVEKALEHPDRYIDIISEVPYREPSKRCMKDLILDVFKKACPSDDYIITFILNHGLYGSFKIERV